MDSSALHDTAGDHDSAGNIDSTIQAGLAERLVPALLAACFGLLLVYAAGFAGIEELHNAAHDTRHAAAFPCH